MTEERSLTTIEIVNYILLIAVCVWNSVFCSLYFAKTIRLVQTEKKKRTTKDASPFRSHQSDLVGTRNYLLYLYQVLPLVLAVIAYFNCDRIESGDLAWRMLVIGFCVVAALSVLFSILLEIKLKDRTLFRKKFAYLFHGGIIVHIFILMPFVLLVLATLGLLWTV